MALSHAIVGLNSSTATSLFSDPAVTGLIEPTFSYMVNPLSIQNVDSSATVYLGGAGVTSSSYGISLAPGAVVTIDTLGPTELLYAISSASSNVAVLMVTSA